MLGIPLHQFFLNPKGLYALLILVPFILFYIIRPRPKKVVIPSLMFLIKDRDQNNFSSFLQHFFKDILFYLQLLVFLLLSASVARPFMEVPSISYVDSMVFIIDGSASMNAIEDGKTRFELAKEKALELVESKNTVILATDRSHLIIENAGAKETKEAIESLQPRETSSSLYDAVVLAEQFTSGDNSGAVVLSDFSSERLENEFMRARSYLESKGIDVFIEDVSKNKARNIGIIDMDIKDVQTTIWVKNYNANSEKVKLTVNERTQETDINAHDVKSFTFDTPAGKTTVKLDVNDDFKPDNFAYISTPEKGSTNIMLITNSNEKYLVAALEVMNKISVNKNSPPIVVFNNPDVIILGDVNKDVMIPGDITRIKQLVRDQGVPLIILAQDDLMKLPLTDMFPLELIKSTPQSVTDIVVPTNKDSYLTPSEIQFGQTRKLYETKENENVNVIAQTTKVKYPVITISTYGKGKIMYYGLFDEYSDFKSDIYYPIFWKRSLDLLLGGKTLAELNKKTGFMETLGKEESVNTPKGVVKGSAITLDYAGIYEFDSYNVAANILNEEEQRLNKDTLSLEESKLSIESKVSKEEKKEKDLTLTLVYILTALFILEYFYLKFRGDI